MEDFFRTSTSYESFIFFPDLDEPLLICEMFSIEDEDEDEVLIFVLLDRIISFSFDLKLVDILLFYAL